MVVDPYDERGIGANDEIIRRINPVYHVVWDKNRQRNRISSIAFNKSSGPHNGMSVDVEALMIAVGVDPKVFVTTPVYTGSVAFPAGAIRALDLWIGYEPIKDVAGVVDNPYHAEVWTKEAKRSFSEAQKSGLARLARWYVEIPEVDII